jgi:hypothetical protein
MTKTNIVRLAARAKSVGLSATIAGSGVRNVLANETVGKVEFSSRRKRCRELWYPVR